MTSDPDSASRRRPPTIDLKATEVESEQPASTQQAEAANPSGDGDQQRHAPGGGARWDFVRSGHPPSSGIAARAVAAIAGAIVTLAILVALWAADLVPARERVPQGATEYGAADIDRISARLDKIEAALVAQRPDPTLAARIASAEAETKAFAESLAALNHRLDDIATTARNALAHADAASAAAETAKNAAQQPGVPQSALDALANRIAALERAVKALSEDVAQRTASADDRVVRLTVAAEALRATLERGAPYEAELAVVRSLGVEENALAPLEPFAAEGLPSAATLARELAALAPALLRASGVAPSESSFLERLQANARKLVRVSPIDAPQGDDPAAVVARIDIAAARADIAAARAEIVRLPKSARVLAASWVKKVDARDGAIAASRRIATDALAALGRRAAQ